MSPPVKRHDAEVFAHRGMNVTVVGDGINASSIVFELMKHKKRIHKITIVGPKGRKNSGTMAAPGMLNVETEAVERDIKHPVLSRSLKFKNYARSLMEDRVKELERKSTVNIPMVKTTYLLDNGLSDLRTRNFEAAKKASDFLGNAHVQVDPSQFMLDHPILQPASGLPPQRVERFDHEGAVHPSAMLEAYDQVFAKSKLVDVIDAYVSKITYSYKKDEDTVHADGVLLDNGKKIDADLVILANGSWATETLAASGLGDLTQKIFHGVGGTMNIDRATLDDKKYALNDVIREVNSGLGCGGYWVPADSSRKGIQRKTKFGTFNFPSQNPTADMRHDNVEQLQCSFEESMHPLSWKTQYTFLQGYRPLTADGLESVGRLMPGLLMASGGGRTAFTISVGVGKVIAEHAIHGHSEIEQQWLVDPATGKSILDPTRTITPILTRAEGQTEFCDHKMNDFRARDREIEDFIDRKFVEANTSHLKDDPALRNRYRKDCTDDLLRSIFANHYDSVSQRLLGDRQDFGIPIQTLHMYEMGYIKHDSKFFAPPVTGKQTAIAANVHALRTNVIGLKMTPPGGLNIAGAHFHDFLRTMFQSFTRLNADKADNILSYPLGSDSEEVERQGRQAEIVSDVSTEFLRDHFKIRPGMRVLEFGHGNASCASDVRQCVGKSGFVLCVYSSRDAVDLANRKFANQGWNNMLAIHGTPTTLALPKEFAKWKFHRGVTRYGTQWMANLDQELRAIRENWIMPKGVLGCQEVDWGTARSIPSVSPFDTACETVRDALKDMGISPTPASDLMVAMINAGFQKPTQIQKPIMGYGDRNMDIAYLTRSMLVRLRPGDQHPSLEEMMPTQAGSLFGRSEVATMCTVH